MKNFKNIRPTMFRVLSNLYDDEKEFNDKIIQTGIVPPTKLLSGSGVDGIPHIRGSVWSLNYEYVAKDLYENREIHSILRKKTNIECTNGKLKITHPEGCEIEENEAEGVMVLCKKPVKFDSAEVTGNPVVNKGKRRIDLEYD